MQICWGRIIYSRQSTSSSSSFAPGLVVGWLQPLRLLLDLHLSRPHMTKEQRPAAGTTPRIRGEIFHELQRPGTSWYTYTVDGWNPVNQLRLVVCPIIFRFYKSQVVQDFSHQQYHSCAEKNTHQELQKSFFSLMLEFMFDFGLADVNIRIWSVSWMRDEIKAQI